jgi:hypothetical protein
MSTMGDRWQRRDFPVLVEATRQVDAREAVDVHAMAVAADTDEDGVDEALAALEDAGYLDTIRGPTRTSGDAQLHGVRLRERGLRATGLWPNDDDQADALVQVLEQAADQVSDGDDQSALRKAGRLLRGVPAAVLADVTAALIRQQAGI